uniref:Uncharacterized protein n=1 Tax=Opuntia streptacantha TaxID=393608 RepID=A0A7C8ZDR4_OPUST
MRNSSSQALKKWKKTYKNGTNSSKHIPRNITGDLALGLFTFGTTIGSARTWAGTLRERRDFGPSCLSLMAQRIMPNPKCCFTVYVQADQWAKYLGRGLVPRFRRPLCARMYVYVFLIT